MIVQQIFVTMAILAAFKLVPYSVLDILFMYFAFLALLVCILMLFPSMRKKK